MRKNKWLRLLLITACVILNTAVLPVFAAHTDGHTDVTARIENVHEETETADPGDVLPGGETNKVPDSQPAQTGDDSKPEVWIALLLISGCMGCGSVLYGRRKRIM